jgi:hypothetical protein
MRRFGVQPPRSTRRSTAPRKRSAHDADVVCALPRIYAFKPCQYLGEHDVQRGRCPAEQPQPRRRSARPPATARCSSPPARPRAARQGRRRSPHYRHPHPSPQTPRRPRREPPNDRPRLRREIVEQRASGHSADRRWRRAPPREGAPGCPDAAANCSTRAACSPSRHPWPDKPATTRARPADPAARRLPPGWGRPAPPPGPHPTTVPPPATRSAVHRGGYTLHHRLPSNRATRVLLASPTK